MTDINSSFQKLLSATFEKIDGVLVEKIIGGYMYRGKVYATLEQVQEAIKNDIICLGNSIIK